MALLTLGAGVFVATGLWMLDDPDGTGRYSAAEIQFWGYACIVFFGLCGLVGVASLVRPAEVRVGPDGVRLRTVLRRRHWAWRDIDDIGIYQVRATKMVTFNARTTGRAMSALNAAVGAANTSLPTGLSMAPERLAELLKAGKARWG